MGIDKAAADELVAKANAAHQRALEIGKQFEGQDMPEDARANRKAAVDEAIKFKEQADAMADAIASEADVARKAAAFADWSRESAGRLAGMGTGGSATEAEASGGGRVSYKASNGEVKNYTPTGTASWKATDEVAYTDTYRRFLTGGQRALTADDAALVARKALSMGSDVSGGFLVASEVMYAGIIEALEASVFMRQVANVLPPFTSATSLSVATAGDTSAAEWTSEISTGTLDTTAPFGARKLTPHPLAKPIKVSNTLLRLATMDVEAWIRGQIADRFAAAEESAFMVGTGAQQPEGVFVSSLPTDVTAASATTIAYADLVGVETALPSQYSPGSSWIFNRVILGELMLILDGNSRPILRDIPGAGTAQSLFGYPINRSEYAPGVSSTGAYVGALGDWKRAYWIVDTLNTTIQVVDQLYAATNETGYFARKETDGMVVDGNGVVRLKMA